MTIKELFEYMKNGTEEQNEEALSVVDEIMNVIKTKFPLYYKKYETKLEDIYSYSALTEKEAKEYVSHMKNKDGSMGEHWSLDQVKAYISSRPEYASLNILDFYVAINMMYSDYYKASYTTDNYASMAKDFVADKDAPSNKVVRYMEAMK